MDEVRELLGIALVEGLLKDGEGPALGAARLLHGVVVALGAVGERAVAAEEVGIGHALVAVDLDAVVHAAVLGPAVLRHAGNAVFKFHDGYRIVIAVGNLFVEHGLHIGIDALGLGSARHPAEPCHGMAAHVHHHATARRLCSSASPAAPP